MIGEHEDAQPSIDTSRDEREARELEEAAKTAYLPPAQPAVPPYPVNQLVIHRASSRKARTTRGRAS
jgi:hypothetical protein